YTNSPEQNISITIPTNEEEIDDVSVTIDIASNFNFEISEYQIELYHPSGISIILDTLSIYKPKSIIYTDNGTQSDIDELDFSGILIPDQPLSSFAGLSSAGEWEIAIIPTETDWFSYPVEVLGVCLNLNTTNCSSSFSGKAFYDLNQNNTMDEDEPSPSFPIIQKNGSEEFFGGISGEFWNCPEEGEITLEVLNPAMYFESTETSFSIEEDDQLSGILVPLTPSEFLPELSVDLFSYEPNRPGFEASYFAQVTNNGTICQDGVSIEIEFPDYVEILSSEEPNLVISDNTAFLEIDQSCPFVSHGFQLTVLLDSTVVLGTILEAHITADIAEDDPNPSNNTFTSVVEVVGSYDPNDKRVSATTIGDDFLEDGSPLKYTIRFQNTGTFYAERVVIADTIDADLDINSLNIISTSHNMELSREGNVLYFEFDQIFLPDSTTDFDGSIGHVRYEIDPLPTFSEGETIDNTAYIYFDFNEPIVTNTVVTEFGNPLSVSNESTFETRLFPNPADQNITISWSQDVEVDRVEIFDLSGRLVKSRNVSVARNFVMEVNDLTNGMYLL
ncbi:MAG: T9SS type A sorting domain-containing protein, partial [Cryomorphaceae bacterium]